MSQSSTWLETFRSEPSSRNLVVAQPCPRPQLHRMHKWPRKMADRCTRPRGRNAGEASESDLSSSRCPTDLTTTTNMWPTRGQRTPHITGEDDSDADGEAIGGGFGESACRVAEPRRRPIARAAGRGVGDNADPWVWDIQ
jgi:hypothetical protein